MEVQTETHEMLELVLCPAFCAKQNTVTCANAAARALCIAPGDAVAPLLRTGQEEYADFCGGSLYLQLNLGGQTIGACVSRVGDEDVFTLNQAAENERLQVLALAARELRDPLNDLMAISGGLLPQAIPDGCERADDLLARLNRGLHQMQRILSNMSDAGQGSFVRIETRNLRAVFSEIFSKAAVLLEHTGVSVSWSVPEENVLGQIDRQMMERAVLNILSNAAKFLPGSGGHIEIRLTRRGNTLHLCISDNGSGIPDEVLPNVFTRYQRQSGLEDGRFGLGLGMVLIRETAACHGGTVLIQRPGTGGTVVSMTMKITADPVAQVRCTCTDLTGGQDPALVELSQVLPAQLYRRKK